MVKFTQKMHSNNRISRIIDAFSLNNHNRFNDGNLSYKKLPGQLLQITILKLDGSSFSVHVSKNATVSGLELAVEEVYGVLPEDEGNVLWSLIWSHFCLSYKGNKLINEKAFLQSYGIKDGDQLRFSRHMRIDREPSRLQTGDSLTVSQHQALSSACDERADDQESEWGYFKYEKHLAFPQEKSNLSHSVKGWLSHSKFHCLGRGRGTI